jgi:uncharacterized protein YcfL
MKKLLLVITITLLLVSCKNHKTKILERQKQLQSEINKAEVGVYIFNANAQKLLWHKSDELDSVSQDKYNNLTDSAKYYEMKKAKLIHEYDSLDTELKKYK